MPTFKQTYTLWKYCLTAFINSSKFLNPSKKSQLLDTFLINLIYDY
ncbi:hypothetical protein ES899_09415 [Clostridioides difficile]|nr:hypothetical protein [Clostridioides difficile]EGT3781280.1 hypothetical protein [Clostridioides difficile]EGT3789919.1 hypothetical protein [Clostridioides difficile]EGT4186846.1 hypothetical protein [Clostridioides difficile]EGT4216829.1 hypothetical protein [Clostridioides difficile]